MFFPNMGKNTERPIGEGVTKKNLCVFPHWTEEMWMREIELQKRAASVRPDFIAERSFEENLEALDSLIFEILNRNLTRNSASTRATKSGTTSLAGP